MTHSAHRHRQSTSTKALADATVPEIATRITTNTRLVRARVSSQLPCPHVPTCRTIAKKYPHVMAAETNIRRSALRHASYN